MNISEVMTRGVETVSPGGTIGQAAKKMATLNIGFLPVLESEKVIGVVTDRDIVTRAVSAGLNAHMTTVRQVMTRKAFTCHDDEALTDASLIMEKNLVDRHERLVGIVSLSDIDRGGVKRNQFAANYANYAN